MCLILLREDPKEKCDNNSDTRYFLDNHVKYSKLLECKIMNKLFCKKKKENR